MSADLVARALGGEELDRKRQELAALESELADRELYLLDLRARIAGFEGVYLREVGTLYAELDEWNARIAELRAQRIGTQHARAAASRARAQANESHAAAHSGADVPPFAPSSELRRLWREVARQIHPDNATGDADREFRNRLMAEANDAYRRGDTDTLRRILQEYRSSPESVVGTGVPAELERISRQIDRIQRRLAQIEAEILELTSSEIAQLLANVDTATANGRDLLSEMKSDIGRRIALAKAEYDSRSEGSYE